MEMAAAPRLPRIAQLHTLDSMRMKAMILDRPEERSLCVRCFGAIRLFVLLCSCPSRAVPVGVEGKNNHYLKLIAIVDSTVR